MNEREKKNLSRQLRMQADYVSDNKEEKELWQSIISTCNALMKSVSGSQASALTSDELERLYAGYLAIGTQITKFFGQAEQISKSNQTSDAKEQIVARLKEEQNKNEILLEELTEKKRELETLKKQQKQLETEKERLLGETAETAKKIDLLPEENKRLLQEYEEKEELLKKLQKAQTECNKEEQKKLQNQIDTLIPEVETLQTNCRELSERLEGLKNQKTRYDSEKQILSTNVLELVEQSLSGLQKALGEHTEILNGIKNRADELASKVKECDRIRKGYKDWFEIDKTPLDAMREILKQPEFIQLQQTMDLSQTETIKNLMNQIRHDLNQLDGIVEKCVNAVHLDQMELERRTRP